MVPMLVLIATIPPRRSNLLNLLSDLSSQTVMPRNLVVLLDGGEDWDPYTPENGIETLTCAMSIRFPIPQGAGNRWRILEGFAVADDPIVLVLDDDLRIDPDYCERTVAEMERLNARVVSWTGVPTCRVSTKSGIQLRRRRTYIGFGDEVDKDVMLKSVGTGACAFRKSLISGMTSVPRADRYLKVGGDDEFLFSRFVGTGMWRPAGAAPLRSVDELQYAHHAMHIKHRRRWEMERLVFDPLEGLHEPA